MRRATLHCTMQPWGEALRGAGREQAGPLGACSTKPFLPLPPIRNQPEVTQVLLSVGCPADTLNSSQSTALHLAVQRGFLEVVRVLCEHGCDVNLPVSAGQSPLLQARV